MCLAAMLILGFSGVGTAQSSLIEVRAAVDQSLVTVGDPIVYTLEIDRRRDVQLKDPVKGTAIGSFEVREFRPLPVQETGDRIIQRFQYTIAVYDTGQYMIPSYPIAYLPGETSAENPRYNIITSDPIPITVTSVIEGDTPELQDIRPPAGLPGSYWWVWAIVATLLIALAIWYFIRRRKSGAPKPMFRKEIIRPAHEIALQALEQLLRSDLLKNGQFKTFYTILSDILRRYLEGRFYIRALEETTGELISSLKESQISSATASLAIQALNSCDLVKFAKHVPGAEETQKTVALVRGFIQQTRLEFQEREISERVDTPTTEQTVESK